MRNRSVDNTSMKNILETMASNALTIHIPEDSVIFHVLYNYFRKVPHRFLCRCVHETLIVITIIVSTKEDVHNDVSISTSIPKNEDKSIITWEKILTSGREAKNEIQFNESEIEIKNEYVFIMAFEALSILRYSL